MDENLTFLKIDRFKKMKVFTFKQSLAFSQTYCVILGLGVSVEPSNNKELGRGRGRGRRNDCKFRKKAKSCKEYFEMKCKHETRRKNFGKKNSKIDSFFSCLART
jgi:hypothetical protein